MQDKTPFILFFVAIHTSTKASSSHVFFLPEKERKAPRCLGFPRLPLAPPPIYLISCGLRAMETQWIPALAGGRAPALVLRVFAMGAH